MTGKPTEDDKAVNVSKSARNEQVEGGQGDLIAEEVARQENGINLGGEKKRDRD